MAKSIPPRDIAAFTQELARADGESVADAFAGLSLLFGAVGALVLGAGAFLQAPLFGFSAGFALAAALGFGLGARALRRRDGFDAAIALAARTAG